MKEVQHFIIVLVILLAIIIIDTIKNNQSKKVILKHIGFVLLLVSLILGIKFLKYRQVEVLQEENTLVFTWDENSISGNLFGSITKPVYVGQSANSFAMIFIVEFQPAGYYVFSGIPQKEFTNLVFSFDDINAPLNKLIAQRLEMAHSIESFIVEVDKLFLSHLKMELCSQEFSIANQMIVNSGGQLSVKDIAQNVYYSERHLNRL